MVVQGSDVISAMELLNKNARFQRLHSIIVPQLMSHWSRNTDVPRGWLDCFQLTKAALCHILLKSSFQAPTRAIMAWPVRQVLAIWIAMWDGIVAIWDLGNFMQRCKHTPPCTAAMLQSIKPFYVMLQVRLCNRSAIERGFKSIFSAEYARKLLILAFMWLESTPKVQYSFCTKCQPNTKSLFFSHL